MQIEETSLRDCYIVHTNPFVDFRGTWTRFFCNHELSSILQKRQIVNINHSGTKYAGTVRGMHYQNTPYAEMKLIRCTKGRIFDVAIDIRKGSPTFLKWFGTTLSADSMDMMVIPEGFAHGFQALEDDVEMIYLHTEYYSSEYEGGIYHADSTIGIKWPIPTTNLSERDLNLPKIASNFTGIDIN